MKQINWGIIGLGAVAFKFAEGFKFLDKAKLLGIASKDSNKLNKFQEKFEIDNNYCFNNYENLLENSNIDIIYIALPTSFHHEWISKCLEKGKKVLVEKPATMNSSEIIDAICFVMKQDKYWDFEDQELYNREPINVKYGKDFKQYTATKAFQSHPDRKVCKDFKYQPTKKPERYIKIKKSLYINTYEPNDLIPNPKADTDLFWALVKHVIPHEEYRNYFLDWFAFPMQKPGVKIRYAMIFQSTAKQLGKGSLFDMQRSILGFQNTNKIDLWQALNRERGFLIKHQTVLIDEAKASGRWSEKQMLVNTLKILIS